MHTKIRNLILLSLFIASYSLYANNKQKSVAALASIIHRKKRKVFYEIELYLFPSIRDISVYIRTPKIYRPFLPFIDVKYNPLHNL